MNISYLALHIFTFVAIQLRELNYGENQSAIFVSLESKSNPINSNFLFPILPSKSLKAKYENYV